MGKVALILVGIASFIGLFVSITTRDNVVGATEQVADHQHEILARTATVAAHNKAVQRLAESFGAYSDQGVYNGSAYQNTVEMTNGGTRAVILSEGTSVNRQGESLVFHIRAEYEPFAQPTGIADEAPPFMRYAVLADDNLLLNGTIDADVCEICIDGSDEITLNANMHTNGNLHVQGNASSVRGFGTHVGTGTSNPNKALGKTFDPYYNPSGAESTQQVPSIDMPIFSAQDMATALVSDSISTGDVVLSGNLDLGGTRENPYVWHIQGNLTSSGETILSGYVLFLVEGTISFTGSLEAGASGHDGADESSIGLYTQGDVEFGGNVDVWGQIFCGGDVTFEGTPTVYGSVTSKNGVNFGGTVNIFYRRASPALTTYWNGDTVVRLRRLAYSEW